MAPISGTRPQWAARTHARQCATTSDCAPLRVERTIITIRQRLAAQLHPGTRYSLIRASSLLAELQALQIRPLPGVRTTLAPTAKQVRVERVLERNGVTLPRVRLAPFLATTVYPTPQANESNQLHQVDGVGPIYLEGHYR
jgi:hypothetical protein